MAEQTILWDGHVWSVERGEHVWTLSYTTKRRMSPITRQVRIADAPTFADLIPALEAAELRRLEAETAQIRASESLAGQRAEEAGYQQTKAILGALERGMPAEQIEAALEGRPYRPGRAVARCPRCGQTGYDGEYPFSTGYASGLCDDCGG